MTKEPDLLRAIRDNDRAEVERLLANGASASAVVGSTYPLWVAVEHDCPEVITVLAGRGADPGRRQTSHTALLAVLPPKPRALRALLAVGANPSGVGSPILGTSRDGKHPVHWAAEQASLECVKILLDAGASANQVSPQGETVLDIALRIQLDPLVDLILDRKGYRCVELRIADAATRGDFAKARRALSEAHRPATEDADATARLRAMVLRDPASDVVDDARLAARLLLEGADPFGPTGDTLALAASHERKAVLPVLLAAVEEPPTQLLFDAIEHRRGYALSTLLLAGVDIRGCDAKQRSALHYAAKYGSVALAETLLEYGLSPAARDASGLSPLDLAEGDSGSDDARDLLSWHAFKDAAPSRVGSSLAVATGSRGIDALDEAAESWWPSIRDRTQLAGVAAHHVDSARDSILLRAAAPVPDSEIRLGESKFGGSPDLPPAVAWPRHGFHGTPLSFLAQVHLEDLAHHGAASALPASGHLLFFYLADQQPLDFVTNPNAEYPTRVGDADHAHAARVIWAPNTKDCVRTVVPRTPGERAFFEPRRLSFASGLTLPEAARLDEETEERIQDLRPPGLASWEVHRMFGFPETQQQGPRCTHDSDWILLLQIGSHDGFGWGGGGLLYFQIHSNDLSSRNFDRIFVEWEST